MEIKIWHLHLTTDPLTNFLKRQIREANLDGVTEFQSLTIEQNPFLVEKYNITKTHNLLFFKDNELVRNVEGPFSAAEIEYHLEEVREGQ